MPRTHRDVYVNVEMVDIARGAVLSGLALIACGGAPHAPPTVPSSAPPTANTASTAASNVTPEAPALPSCADGTCFRCGQGICLSGFYCDQSAAAGAACSWLPSCAKKASCACVERVLGSSCQCKAHDGGVFVSCS